MEDDDVIHKHLAKFKQTPHAPTHDEVMVRILITNPFGEAEERRLMYSVPSDKYATFVTEIDQFFNTHEHYRTQG